ncbi:hypothetical protein Bbelb_380570 [Branchiostoma belcheri]|nr:hypothetical protein Bbelb_380570 [Branchiostoma belcheri]
MVTYGTKPTPGQSTRRDPGSPYTTGTWINDRTTASRHGCSMGRTPPDTESARLFHDHGQNTYRHVQIDTDRNPEVMTYGTVRDKCPEVIPHDETETSKEEEGFSCAKTSKRQILTFLCVAFLNFSGMACSAIITPFFPDESNLLTAFIEC